MVTSSRNLSLALAGLCVGFVLLAGLTNAAERDDHVDFVRDIRPIFAARCYDCHGPQAQESNYRLDRKAAALSSGDRGTPPVVPGNSGDSPLIQFVAGTDSDIHMPPKDEGEPLTAAQIALLRAWIDQGANWPEDVDEEEGARLTTDHWSFQPVANVQPPDIHDPWLANEIDAFLLSRIQAAELTPSPPADRVALIRRLYFDLHGLPPTPEEVAVFLTDSRSDANQQLVERVLASPRYGERWAQHWLDVMRYAESNGFEMNHERSNAWLYRDYVITAFNKDKPYNEFIAEQLAGDALGAPAATGFLVAGPWDQVKSPDLSLTLMQRQEELADMTNTTGSAFLGLTIGCARCHNHKFDPILQKDYFALQAMFAGVQHGERPLLQDGAVAANDELRTAVIATGNEEPFPEMVAKAVRFTVHGTNDNTEPCLDELEIWSVPSDDDKSRNVALAAAGSRLTSSGNYTGNTKHQLAHINDGKYGNDWSWISDIAGKGWVQIDLSQATLINKLTWGRDRLGGFADRLAVDYSIEALSADGIWKEIANSADRRTAKSKAPMVYSGVFVQPEQPTRRLYRGDPMAPKEVVAPDVLTVLGTLKLAADAPEQQRRLALAKWIASPDNPLTARVMVNRIWQHHFGVGLVDTPSDFGANGTRPTHPELLDWLARQFVEHGWSIKHIHRLILLSNAYQQASAPNQVGLARDASCRLLWRFPPRRLEAEAIRDSVLQISGALDLSMGGPGWRAFQPNENYVRVYDPKSDYGPAEWRRMVYMERIRMRPEGVFGAFDAPDGGQTCPRRSRSITALQALNLFNSSFIMEQSRKLAARLRTDAGEEPARQVARAFALALNRTPDVEELLTSQQLIADHGLEAFCRGLLNANELMFIP